MWLCKVIWKYLIFGCVWMKVRRETSGFERQNATDVKVQSLNCNKRCQWFKRKSWGIKRCASSSKVNSCLNWRFCHPYYEIRHWKKTNWKISSQITSLPSLTSTPNLIHLPTLTHSPCTFFESRVTTAAMSAMERFVANTGTRWKMGRETLNGAEVKRRPPSREVYALEACWWYEGWVKGGFGWEKWRCENCLFRIMIENEIISFRRTCSSTVHSVTAGKTRM